MTLEIWIAYVVACTVLLAVPGPTIMLVITHALTRGRRTGFYTVPGVVLGDTAALFLSLVGLGALLSISASLFTAVKLIGAAYLVYLGVQMWRHAGDDLPISDAEAGNAIDGKTGWRLGFHAFAVTTLNPKGIVFFIAFLPQFIVPSSPVLPQLVLLGSTFVVLGGVNAALYAVLAGSLNRWLRKPGWMKAINRAGGGFLIGAGVTMAAMRRSA